MRWPAHGRPTYAEHDTEQAAEAHAIEIVRSGKASVATAYWCTESEETA